MLLCVIVCCRLLVRVVGCGCRVLLYDCCLHVVCVLFSGVALCGLYVRVVVACLMFGLVLVFECGVY